MKWFRILAVTLSFVVLLTTLFGCGPKSGTFPVTSPDANLEVAIREALNNPENPIYTSGLESLTTLDYREGGISDLTGLEYYVNLGELILYNNNNSDLFAESGYTQLELLGLGLVDPNISDISTLAGLTNLQILSLRGNNISDISPLVENSGLSAGDTVDLRDNPLSTTSVDVYIPQLEARGVTLLY